MYVWCFVGCVPQSGNKVFFCSFAQNEVRNDTARRPPMVCILGGFSSFSKPFLGARRRVIPFETCTYPSCDVEAQRVETSPYSATVAPRPHDYDRVQLQVAHLVSSAACFAARPVLRAGRRMFHACTEALCTRNVYRAPPSAAISRA